MNKYFAINLTELENMTRWLYNHDIPCVVSTEPSWSYGKTIITVEFDTIDNELYLEFDELFGSEPETIIYKIGA